MRVLGGRLPKNEVDMENSNTLGRRLFLTGAASLAGTAVIAQDSIFQRTLEIEKDITTTAKRNISSFRVLDWQPYFDDLKNGAILVDITSRALHYWNEDESIYKLYPTSVPLSEDLTKRGRTRIIHKVDGPSWRPTPTMRLRNPEWPEYIAPGDPSNPMGTHALYLSWTYYRIHGTHDTRKIGRRSSNGCIGLYNKQIAELFTLTKVGTQVLLI